MKLLLLLVAMGAGCDGARLGGKIDGEPVGGARDAYFDTWELKIGPFSAEYRVVVLSSFADGCTVMDDFLSAVTLSCDDTCDELVPLAEEHHLVRDAYWTTTFVANVSDGVAGEFGYDDQLGAGEFSTTYASWDTSAVHDVATCKEVCSDGDLLQATSEPGEDGTLELDESDDGTVLSGRFDVDFGGDDVLSGAFTAHDCDIQEQWVVLN